MKVQATRQKEKKRTRGEYRGLRRTQKNIQKEEQRGRIVSMRKLTKRGRRRIEENTEEYAKGGTEGKDSKHEKIHNKERTREDQRRTLKVIHREEQKGKAVNIIRYTKKRW